jgi:nucleotide-binding universal stress UspA family protein
MRWLLMTDGEARFQIAAEYAAPLIHPEEDEVVLLGLSGEGEARKLETALQAIRAVLRREPVRTVIHTGDIVESVEKVVKEEAIGAVVYASRGRHGFSRLLLGSVAAHLEENLPVSILFVRDKPEPVRKILVAISVSETSANAVRFGGRLARLTGAEVTLLHVMSQVPLTDNASMRPLRASADEAIAEGTAEGLHLARQMQQLQAWQVRAKPILRHGLVIDEIMRERQAGGYQLLIIGAHETPDNLPFADLLLANFAEEVLMNTRCPLLIVR